MPDRSTTVAGYATQSTFDANRNVIYTAAANGIQRLDLTTGAVLPQINLAGENRSVAVSPDGQYLVVGRAGHTITDGIRSLHLIRIDLNTGEQVDLSIPMNSWSRETTVDQVVITASGAVLFSTQYEGSGHTPVRSFPLLSASPPAFTEIGSAYMPQLIISPDRTQVLITTDNLSSSSFQRYEDGTPRAVQTGIGQFGSGGPGTGGGDIANNGMMLRTDNQGGFVVVDKDFNLLRNFGSEAVTRGYGDGQFSSDGRLMFAFATTTNEIDVYDTTTWTRVKTFAAPTPAPGHYLWGQLDLIGDDFLVLVGAPYRYLVDLGARLNFSLTGTAANETIDGYGYGDTLSGADGADLLRGRAGDDRLDGGNGDDRLAGGTGADTLIGGAGSDTADYSSAAGGVSARLDTGSASQDGDGGVDSLTGIENLTGSAFADTLFGSSGANRLEGGRGRDILLGLGGDDVLVGGAVEANDMYGGAGNDRYIVISGDSLHENAGEGVDTVETAQEAYTLKDNFENLVYAGTGAFRGIGNAANNQITGGSGDDVLTGGAGNDVLTGGAGTDTADYSASTGGVTARADSGVARDGQGGIDTLNGIENLTGSAFDDVMVGNAGANVLIGGRGHDVLLGLDGNDLIRSGSGETNQVFGGLGDDIYEVENRLDSIIEYAGEGTDLVRTALGQVNLANNVEQLTYTGAGSFIGVGNNGANVITGGLKSDVLIGLGGDDTLIGGIGGGNQLFGGAGDDIYVLFVADSLVETANNGIDTVQSQQSLNGYVLGNNVENLVHMGSNAFRAWGNALNNVLTGGIGDDTLVGYAGNDTLIGGVGRDTADYNKSLTGVTVDLTAGVASNDGHGGADTLSQIEDLVGSAFADRLTGDSGANRLAGGLGADLLSGMGGDDILDGGSGAGNELRGGAGNDRYIISTGADVIVELAGEGVDTVETTMRSFVLADNVENLTYLGAASFTGTGNSQNNILTGGTGDDVLMSSLGQDTLNGGAGRDTANYSAATAYITVDMNAGVVTGGGDTQPDTLQSIETVVGSAFNDHFIGNGSSIRLEGGLGADTFQGSGDETFAGGAGDDIYMLRYGGGAIVELANGGYDLVFVSWSDHYVLGDNLEDLIFDQNFSVYNPLFGVGNGLNNRIYTNDGNDYLVGQGGNDVLYADDGFDTAVLSGVLSDYVITATTYQGEAAWLVTDKVAGRDGVDTLVAVEQLLFSDNSVYALGSSAAAAVQPMSKGADAFVLPALAPDQAQVLPRLNVAEAFDGFDVPSGLAERLFLGLEAQVAQHDGWMSGIDHAGHGQFAHDWLV